MKESIILQCPKCGRWYKVPYQGAFDRGTQKMGESAANAALVAGSIAEAFGAGKKTKKAIESATSFLAGATYIPLLKAGAEAFFGSPYQCTCECGCELSAESDEEDKSEEFEEYLESISPVNIVKNKYIDIDHTNKNSIHEFINEVEDILQEVDNDDDICTIRHFEGAAFWSLKDYKSTLKCLNYVKSADDGVDEEFTDGILAFEALVKGELGLDDQIEYNAYSLLPALVKYSQSKTIIKDAIYQESIRKHTNRYVETFLESIPAKDRRFIVFSNDFNRFPRDFYVLPLNNLPQGLLIEGDVEENLLYIKHPYKPNTYIRSDNYVLELFRDKVYEFKKIMVRLGAKEFSFTDTQSFGRDKENHTERSASGKVAGDSANVSAKFDYERGERENLKLYNEVSETIKYNRISEYPCVPEKVVWYNHEENWQEEVANRLRGATNEADYTITLNSSELVSANKRHNLDVALNWLKVGGELNYGDKVESTLNIESCHTWKCHVEFYPLDEYQTKKK